MSTQSCILIVDDEEIGRNTLESLLLMEGYQLEFANNGVEALKKAESVLPDLILLDVMMPIMDGYECCQHLRQNPLLAEVPVIIVTTLDSRDSLLRGIDVGADDFISKPFDRLELRARVRTITRLNRQRCLLNERAKFAWVVENADEGYVLITPENIIKYANPQACVFLGTNKSRLLEQDFFKIIQQQYNPQPPEAWTSWQHNELIRYLVLPESREHPPLWLQIDVLPLPARVENGYLLRLMDVTEKIVLARQRWAFNSSISHKLLTPLNGLSILNIFKEEDFTNAQAHDYMKLAQGSAERLADQISGILQYLDSTGIFYGGFTQVLAGIEYIFRQLCEEMGLKQLVVQFDAVPLTTEVLISGQAIELILRELLINAKKFHPEKQPSMSISAEENKEEHLLVLHIVDDGTTIAATELKKVLQPYYQSGKYFTGEIAGMGLGLAMVSQLLWGIGGNCSITNRLDGKAGTEVVIAIPTPA
ncbi:response regulator [Beggiatoa leptomitoformis]|uniref:hybrid sensor histidine kinase/response regulator n=1 Tax=Beggiatoa leptomitoformis TaxID=288004 RepID=UPI000785A584|nr:response regulator [Beggiatoa leptomitoformis]QGX03763.1 response regulator [Beggiatoa leptomitoformis]